MLKKTKNSSIPSIGIDLLGSDADSNTILESALPTLEKMKDCAHFVLFAEEKNLPLLNACPFLSYKIASEVISMEDDPLGSVRKKKDSSICLGIHSLKQQEIDAFISMGNTGALLASATIELKTLQGIKRPALLISIPTEHTHTTLLDVGGNAECDSSHLLGFAAMGVAYQKVNGNKKPTIGLINIGKEPSKGSSQLKKTYETLSTLNKSYDYPIFQGNIEGGDIFQGKVDVLITDGFTGNIVLKSSEGIARFILKQTDKEVSAKLKTRFDSSHYPGATLCGVNGIVIKCHGGANAKALHFSLLSAFQLIEERFLENIDKEISSFFLSSF
jgi:phosphate acyltransferase